MSYIGTSIQVATDWVVAITPFFIVRNLQMNQRKKISVCAILGLGVLASFAAIMRIAMYPQTDERYYPKDNLGKYTSFSSYLVTNCPLNNFSSQGSSARHLVAPRGQLWDHRLQPAASETAIQSLLPGFFWKVG
jgi:hypothetical protein